MLCYVTCKQARFFPKLIYVQFKSLKRNNFRDSTIQSKVAIVLWNSFLNSLMEMSSSFLPKYASFLTIYCRLELSSDKIELVTKVTHENRFLYIPINKLFGMSLLKLSQNKKGRKKFPAAPFFEYFFSAASYK